MTQVIYGREYPEQADAIVIGAGIGGLFCANFLARAGMKVVLLERHYALGGYCSTFRRKGFVFDAANHSYPLLGNPGSPTGKLLRELEVPTAWVKMDPVDQYHFPGMAPFAVPADFRLYTDKLKTWFREEARSVDAYFAEVQRAYHYGPLRYFRGTANEQAASLEPFTVTQKLEEYFRDPRLKAILMADCPRWGSLPNRTSYVFDAMMRMAYFLGNYYPVGGSQQFADDLGRTLEARGGRVLKCAEVESILIENRRARGVRIRTLSRRSPRRFEFRAPFIVSNADAMHTYRDLIGEERCGRAVVERLETLTPTYPCFMVHIGLQGTDPAALACVAGYHWSSFDPEDAIRTVFKIFIPTQFSPNLAPPGCQILIVQKLTPVRLDQVTDWGAHKAKVEGEIMARLREMLPDIDQHIVTKCSASAMTSHRFTNNWQGAMSGWEMSPDQLGSARVPVTTSIESLFLTGHWTRPGGGITAVIISAQRLANFILTGKNDGLGEAIGFYALDGALTQ